MRHRRVLRVIRWWVVPADRARESGAVRSSCRAAMANDVKRLKSLDGALRVRYEFW